MDNEADIFVKKNVSDNTIKFLRYYYDKAKNMLKNPIKSHEMCIRSKRDTVEVYLYEREHFLEEYIEQRMQLIECFFWCIRGEWQNRNLFIEKCSKMYIKMVDRNKINMIYLSCSKLWGISSAG